MGGLLGQAFGLLLTTINNLFGSWRFFLGVTCLSLLGIVLYNVLVELMGDVLTWVMGELTAVPVGELPSTRLQLTGLGAWIAQETYLSQQVGIAVTAVSLKWLVVKIPFLKW